MIVDLFVYLHIALRTLSAFLFQLKQQLLLADIKLHSRAAMNDQQRYNGWKSPSRVVRGMVRGDVASASSSLTSTKEPVAGSACAFPIDGDIPGPTSQLYNDPFHFDWNMW